MLYLRRRALASVTVTPCSFFLSRFPCFVLTSLSCPSLGLSSSFLFLLLSLRPSHIRCVIKLSPLHCSALARRRRLVWLQVASGRLTAPPLHQRDHRQSAVTGSALRLIFLARIRCCRFCSLFGQTLANSYSGLAPPPSPTVICFPFLVLPFFDFSLTFFINLVIPMCYIGRIS